MKRNWIAIIIVLTVIVIIGCYAVFDNMFPMANLIDCPDAKSVTKIMLGQKDGVSVGVESVDFERIMIDIISAKPTRIMSVNDYPAVKEYYAIEVDTDARQYRYFLYKDDSQVYIEIPYDGVYKTNQQFLDYITEYFNS